MKWVWCAWRAFENHDTAVRTLFRNECLTRQRDEDLETAGQVMDLREMRMPLIFLTWWGIFGKDKMVSARYTGRGRGGVRAVCVCCGLCFADCILSQ
jgi:hypothetical protein